MKEKCLVDRAREKCQCEWCKGFREMRDFNLKYYIQMQVHKIMMEVLEKTSTSRTNKKKEVKGK